MFIWNEGWIEGRAKRNIKEGLQKETELWSVLEWQTKRGKRIIHYFPAQSVWQLIREINTSGDAHQNHGRVVCGGLLLGTWWAWRWMKQSKETNQFNGGENYRQTGHKGRERKQKNEWRDRNMQMNGVTERKIKWSAGLELRRYTGI